MSSVGLAVAGLPEVREYGIRQFADSQIQESITKALTGIEPGKSGAVVLFADKQAVRGAVVAKLGSYWSVVGTLSREWSSGEISGEAAVRFSW